MRALSLWQPWASLIALGAKRIETRGWQTSYRGPMAIHAAQRVERAVCFDDPFLECLSVGGFARPEELPQGMFVAIAELVEIVPTEAIRESLSDREWHFGNYEAGRFAWKLEQVQPLHAWPGRGRQGLWKLDEATVSTLRARVRDL